MNVSSFSIIFIFTPYENMGIAKNILFTFAFILYIASIIANVILLLLIYLDPSLHKPMYTFLFILILNGLIGSTAVWPKAMNILLTNDNTITYTGCIIQVFIILHYGACNYIMLTVMAYDRFVSIFKPLQYQTIMNPHRIRLLVLFGNLIPFSVTLCEIWLILQIPLCAYTIDKIFCGESLIFLSCDSHHSQVASTFFLCAVFCCIILPACLVLISYFKIILFILKLSVKARKKTFSTCTPHLIFFVTFSVAALFSIAFNRVNPHVSSTVKVIRVFFLATNYILVPPLLHPVIYGIKNKDIKNALLKVRRRFFSSTVQANFK